MTFRRISGRRTTLFAVEFVLIVAGVLAALALDEWRGRLEDRALESAYVERLRNDLISDTLTFSWFSQVLDTKVEVLGELLQEPEAVDWSEDPAHHLSRLAYSTFIGLPPITSATFDEILSTGKVNLLESMELRGELGSYYSFYTRLTTILDWLPGPYRSVVWSSMAGDVAYHSRLDPLVEIDRETFREGVATIRRHPELRQVVNYELSYAGGLREYLTEAQRRAAALLRTIDDLYGESSRPRGAAL